MDIVLVLGVKDTLSVGVSNMNILEVTYYGDNDIQLKNNSHWINKNNINLFVNGKIFHIFGKSIYENDNYIAD